MTDLDSARASHAVKAETVNEVHEKLKTAKIAIVTDYRGLSVAQMTRLRREVRNAAGEYQVIKNTLARRALKDTAYDALERLLEGPNGWAFAYDDPVALSKILVKFAEENDKLAIKGAVFEGELMDPSRVKLLAQMPSKPELQAQLLALIQAPASQLVRVLQEPGARVVRLIEGVRKRRSE
ncbi:MAG TPA: 50S ribosomal protein L10 [Candidatus Eisenbacteria bacterium]|nr:50S ribosomal protein L10 [Candidatus Eisenbacteria bacterium]